MYCNDTAGSAVVTVKKTWRCASVQTPLGVVYCSDTAGSAVVTVEKPGGAPLYRLHLGLCIVVTLLVRQ